MSRVFNLLTAIAFLLLGLYFHLVIGGMSAATPIFISPPSGNALSHQAPNTSHNAKQRAEFPKDQILVEGEKLFKANCASCHLPHRDLTGPALGQARAKYKDDPAFLYAWVRNAPDLIKQGNKKAIALGEWSTANMIAFPSITDEQIESIIAYAEAKAVKIPNPNPLVSALD